MPLNDFRPASIASSRQPMSRAPSSSVRISASSISILPPLLSVSHVYSLPYAAGHLLRLGRAGQGGWMPSRVMRV
ncbi:hypothetical protein BHE90_009863 [Fusarium euwallaceae]|uniref:Uncharacterized protein n=2 Tax=Fusarium solani species complex TaxID=232080 RepID=A0A3M2S4N4_9HYPO|nr:hypothetical protein CDV36_007810 [Fusarium kuroshium]RTE75671.1 hypothetical protein BHE90_009863 [Fusarium euwallaceae]